MEGAATGGERRLLGKGLEAHQRGLIPDHLERLRRQAGAAESRVEDVARAIGVVAKMYDETRQADLGALGVAEHRERRPRGLAMAQEAARAHTEVFSALHDKRTPRHHLADSGADLGPKPTIVGAHEWASRPAWEWLTRADQVEVLGSGGGMLHLVAGGPVVTLAGPGAPLLANAISVTSAGEIPARPGLANPRVPQIEMMPAPAAEGLAEALSARTALGTSRRGRVGLAHLERALEAGDASDAGRASDALLGLGPGLTPEGDDVLVGAALAVAAAGRAVGLSPGARQRLAAALCPADSDRRTTRLSATLLRLAAVGAGPEAMGRVLGGDGAARLELSRLGATSGRALLAATDWSLSALSARARR